MTTAHNDEQAPSEPLVEFFAVTRTSIYRVRMEAGMQASMTKIALKGESQVAVGEDIAEGGMVAVGCNLQAYIPEQYGFAHPLTGVQRDFRQVNTRYWRGHTSAVVGLFFEEAQARQCMERDDLQPADPRWAESSRRVLDAIGDDHPAFFVPRDGDHALFQNDPPAHSVRAD